VKRGQRLTKGQFSWALFDWANQPFFTVVTTFIFAPYFASVVVGDAVRGQALWGYGQAAAGAAVALLSPVLGAIADAGGRRKPWIAGFVALCCASSFALWFATPGMAAPGWIVLAVALGAIGVEFAVVFNNAMLPSVASPGRLGFLSGFGWGLGYLGGLAALFVILLGFALPEQPLFGLDKAAHEPDRLSGPLTAIWFALFVVPLFLYTPDEPRRSPARAALREGLATLARTLRSLGSHRNVLLYLVAHAIYNDGIAAVIGFAGIYAAGAFGWGTTELGLFGIAMAAIAALSCFAGGRLDDRIGSRRTILGALALLAAGAVGAVAVDSQPAFLACAALLGLGFGPAQSASRTLMARLSPAGLTTEFFGLYALSGKATAFLAPLAVALATDAFASQRAGLVSVLLFFVIGAAALWPVREPLP
jgi:UMF1 family MFS transporter